jgi:hypothetical protein
MSTRGDDQATDCLNFGLGRTWISRGAGSLPKFAIKLALFLAVAFISLNVNLTLAVDRESHIAAAMSSQPGPAAVTPEERNTACRKRRRR